MEVKTSKIPGQIELANQTIKKWLGKALNGQAEKRWIDYLNITVYKYNTTVHRATNQSPLCFSMDSLDLMD
jgi:hypothetical protein